MKNNLSGSMTIKLSRGETRLKITFGLCAPPV